MLQVLVRLFNILFDFWLSLSSFFGNLKELSVTNSWIIILSFLLIIIALSLLKFVLNNLHAPWTHQIHFWLTGKRRLDLEFMISKFAPLNELLVISTQFLTCLIYQWTKCDSLLMVNLQGFSNHCCLIILLNWLLNMIHLAHLFCRAELPRLSTNIDKRRWIFILELLRFWFRSVCFSKFV